MTTAIDGSKFVSFTTKSKEPDGSYLVSGRITDATLDLDRQRVDPEWADVAVNKWAKAYGNIREMHQPIAVGKCKSLSGSGANGFDIIAKIVDPGAILKLENDLYTGFSIGIKGTRVDRTDKALATAPNGIINGGDIIEVSIVDVPANPNARFTLAKAAGIGDTLDLHSVVDGTPPCTECSGIGKTLVDGNWSECPKCAGSGEGKNDILPGLNSGPDEHGEIGKTMEPDKDCATCKGTGKIRAGKVDCPDCVQSKAGYITDIYGWSDSEKSVWSDGQKSADVEDAYKKAFTDKERSDLADKDQAMPDGSYPIRNVTDLKNAIASYGRAKNKVATKAWIIRRAKALDSTNLLPEAWNVGTTSKMADALVALSLVNKAAEPGQWTHDPEMLKDVENGIVACIQQELEELCDGEDERWDLQVLLDVLNGYLSWQMHEAFGGETVSPFAQGDDLTMFVSADTMKAAAAENATDEEKAAPAIELAKALGIDKIATSTEDTVKKLAELTEVVETVKKMSAKRDWATHLTEEQDEFRGELVNARAELDRYKSAYAELSSQADRAAYEPLVKEAQSKVDDLTSKIGV